MDEELSELCRKVFEVTEWVPEDGSHYEGGQKPNREHNIVADHTAFFFSSDVPLYTSDFLLEKLPHEVTSVDEWDDEETGTLGLWKGSKGFSCGYLNEEHFIRLLEETDADGERFFRDAEFFGDTAVKSLLGLTLALHAAGELK